MKTKLLLLALISVLIPALLSAEETPLGKQMEGIAKSFKQLNRQISDSSKRDSSLKLVAAIQKSAETAKGLVPSKAKSIPKEDQARFIADYQKGMDGFLAQLTKLSEAIGAGNTQKAQEILDGLSTYKRESHEKFSSE